jgi:hypothetical protein
MASPSMTKWFCRFLCNFSDSQRALRPVIPALNDQTHAIAVALQAQARTIELDLVEPVSASGSALEEVGRQNSNSMA